MAGPNREQETPALTTPDASSDRRRRLPRLRVKLRELYHGDSPGAVRFRYRVLLIDVVLIAFFIAAPFLRAYPVFLVADYAVALILLVDITARALAASSWRAWAMRPILWVDIFVLITLLFPLWLFNLAFLRVLRLWSLVHSDFFWETVGRRYDDTRWEDVGKALASLVTFVFVATGFVYASFALEHPGITGYVDALYFTVATLTTTGFGDITLPGTWGKILAIIIMLVGITLFVRLGQTLIRPYKVRFTCPSCGLMRHDADAVHCKACGVLLNIPNDED